MSSLDQQIQNANDKLQQLVAKFQSIQKENHRLQKDNSRLQQQVDSQNSQVNQLHQKMDAIKLNSTGLDGDVKKDLDKRISIYLKEIDKCLALLNA